MSVTVEAANHNNSIYDAAQEGFSQGVINNDPHIIVELEAGEVYDETQRIEVGGGKHLEIRVDGPGDFAKVNVDASKVDHWLYTNFDGGEITLEGVDAEYIKETGYEANRTFIYNTGPGDLTVINSRFSDAGTAILKHYQGVANQDYNNPVFKGDVTLDGVIIKDSYTRFDGTNGQVKSQGIYVLWGENIIIRNSVIHNNGLVLNANDFAQGNAQNHGAYLDSENAYGLGIVENTIFSSNAGHGLQLRAGGTVSDSLFYRNPLGMFLKNGTVEQSAFFESTDLLNKDTRGQGLEMNRAAGDPPPKDLERRGHINVRDNVFGWKLGTNPAKGALDYNSPNPNYTETITGNYKWDWPDSGGDSNYSGPGLTELANAPALLGDYNNGSGVAAAVDAAINRTRDEYSLNGVNTARSIAAYYRNAATGNTPTVGQITLDSQSVDENQPAGTIVGTLDVINDPSATQTFSLTSGDVNAFSIDQASATLRTAQTFDYETKQSYNVQISATNANGDTVSRTFKISVVDLAETPTGGAVTVDFDQFDGNTSTSNAIATNSAYYQDASGFRFRTVNNFPGDADLFAVDGGSGDAGLRTKAWTQSLQVNRTDGQAFDFQGLTFQPSSPNYDIDLVLTGYLDGVEINTLTLTVAGNSGQTVYNLPPGWSNLDSVTLRQNDAQLIFDDFRFLV